VRGGVAGFHFDLHVDPAGEAVLYERDAELARATLDDEQQTALARLIREAEPADGRAIYGRSDPGVRDGWHRELEVGGAGQSWTIEEFTGAGDEVPAPVRELFQQLMEISMGMRVKALAPGGET
jgi:hypothetical protein